MISLWHRLIAWLIPVRPPLTPEAQAKALIKAIDAGGMPLNAARVNDIARGLGLDVSARAPMEETIARIRKGLNR